MPLISIQPFNSKIATLKDMSTLRRHDLDNLRSFLTGLVVMHHTGAAYGGAGMGGLFKSSLLRDGFVSPALWYFDAFNQTFFMGLFFWMSGRVSAQSLHRIDKQGHGPGLFVKNKAKRLLLPAVVYTVAVNPIVRVLCLPGWNAASISKCVRDYFGSVNGIKGPVWYTATLFAFDFIAAMIIPKANESGQYRKESKLVESCYKFLAKCGWVVVAMTSFIVRLWYPVGKTLRPLHVQPAYAAQYVFAYSMGQLSFTYGPQVFSGPFSSDKMDSSTELDDPPLLSVSFISAITLSLAMLPKFILTPDGWMNEAMHDISGGWNLTALAYAIWNEFSFVLVGPALMKYFYKWYNEPATSWIWQPRYSYAAFLLHYVVSIPVEKGVDMLLLINGAEALSRCQGSLCTVFGPVALTFIVGAINTAGSFTLGRFVVDYIPGMAKIL
jgi:glucan biosynthesis protein C